MFRDNQRKAGAVLSYLQILIHNLSGILYTPVMLRFLGQSEYGLYNLSASTISYLGLLSFGINNSYVHFYSRYQADDDQRHIAKLNGVYLLILCFIAIFALGAGLILLNFLPEIFDKSLSLQEINKAKKLMFILMISLAVTFPASLFSSYIHVQEHFVFQRILSLIKTFCSPFLTIPLLLMGYQSIALALISMSTTIAESCVSVWYCLKKLKIQISFGQIDWFLLKEIWIFSFFIFVNIFIDQVNGNLSKFLLGIYKGSVSVAIYGIASQLCTFYIQLSSTFQTVFTPKINRMVAEKNDNQRLTILFTSVGRIQFMILFFFCLGYIFFGKPFIHFWAGDDYLSAYPIGLILLISMTIPLIQNLGIPIQQAKNKHQFWAVVCFLVSIFNLIVSIPLCKKYGGIGCSIGTSLSNIIGNGIFMNLYYHKKIGLDMKYFWLSILSIFPALIFPAIFGFVVTSFIDLYQLGTLLISGILFSLVFISAIWFFAFNKSEKKICKPFLLYFRFSRYQ